MLNGDNCFEIVSNSDMGEWPMDFGTMFHDPRPSLLIAAPVAHHPEMAAMADGADFRILDTVPLAGMAERLRRTVGVDGLLIDLRGLMPSDLRLDAALVALLAWPGWADARPLLLVDVASLDAVAATLGMSGEKPLDRILCNPSLSEIGLALCLLVRETRDPLRLNDVNRDSDAARLEQLSAEVRRLAQTIDRMMHDHRDDSDQPLREPGQGYAAPPAARHIPPLPARDTRAEKGNGTIRAEVRALLQARRLRDRFLPGDLFADPAWDMMLDLLAARLDGKRVSVSSLCIAAAVPPTTALRWITQLTERGIFLRCNDPDDARRVFISLSDEVADSLADWFAAVRGTGLRFTA